MEEKNLSFAAGDSCTEQIVCVAEVHNGPTGGGVQ